MSFTIRELESLSGIKAHTIRIWEQRYNFLKPARTETNIRTYSNEELKTLLTVSLLNRYGYKISRIDAMAADQRERALIDLPQPDAQLESRINELLGYMIDLKSLEFETLLDESIERIGLERTLIELVFGFMEKVGILWQTNRVLPVQEHIVSNIIRQKIVSAINGLPFVKKESPLYLLFLPEGEHHEMGLLFIYYLLRRQGVPVIYLGANVPLKDVGYLHGVKPVHHLYLHLTTFPRQHNFERFLNILAAQAPGIPILISGSITQQYRKPLPQNVRFLYSLAEVSGFISGL